jgi:RecA-family ATPase
MSAAEIARALGGKRNGAGFLCRCPVPSHGQGRGDRTPSLSIADGDKGLVVKCHAGCDPLDVLAELRRRGLADCSASRSSRTGRPGAAPRPKTIRTISYDYRDPVSAEVRYRKERYEGNDGTKAFAFKTTPAKGYFDQNPHLLYGAERLADIGEPAPVWIVEGEKKVDRLRELGAVAVSGDTGHSSKWLPAHAELLCGLPIILWPDSDEAGEVYVANAAAAILAMDQGAELRVVRPFGPPSGGKGKDICDWSGDAAALAELAASAQPYAPLAESNGGDAAYEPPGETVKPLALKVYNGRDLAKTTPPEREWEIPDMIPAARVTGVSGDGAAGKSLLAEQLGIAVASGTDFIGKLPRKGKALYLTCEDDIDEMHRRLKDIIAGRGDINVGDLVNFEIIDMVGEDALLASLDGRSGRLIPTEVYTAVVNHIEKLFGPHVKGSDEGRIVILDTLAKVYGGDENIRMQVTQFVGFLDKIAIRYHVAIIPLLHPSLVGMSSGTGLSGSTGWHGSMRARMYLTSVPNGEKEPDPCLRQLVVKKNNYGPSGEIIVIRWEKGRYVLMGGKGIIERAAEDAKAEDAYMRMLNKCVKQNIRVSPNPSQSQAARLFAEMEDNGGFKAKDFVNAQRRLLDKGKIVITDYGPPTGHRQRVEPTEE